jgi:hypothetical protein
MWLVVDFSEGSGHLYSRGGQGIKLGPTTQLLAPTPLSVPAKTLGQLLSVKWHRGSQAISFSMGISVKWFSRYPPLEAKGNGMAHRAKEISVWSHRDERTF